MSIGTLMTTMARIKRANPNQPISVFIVEKEKRRYLDAIFANSVEAENRIRAHRPSHPSQTEEDAPLWEWIGDFHNEMPVINVRTFLDKAVSS